jgi:hypothetical protein
MDETNKGEQDKNHRQNFKEVLNSEKSFHSKIDYLTFFMYWYVFFVPQKYFYASYATYMNCMNFEKVKYFVIK